MLFNQSTYPARFYWPVALSASSLEAKSTLSFPASWFSPLSLWLGSGSQVSEKNAQLEQGLYNWISRLDLWDEGRASVDWQLIADFIFQVPSTSRLSGPRWEELLGQMVLAVQLVSAGLSRSSSFQWVSMWKRCSSIMIPLLSFDFYFPFLSQQDRSLWPLRLDHDCSRNLQNRRFNKNWKDPILPRGLLLFRHFSCQSRSLRSRASSNHSTLVYRWCHSFRSCFRRV